MMTSRQVFQHLVILIIAVFVSASVALAKNPFDSCLPEKPKEEVKVVKIVDKNSELLSNQPSKIEIKIEPPILVLTGLIWNSSQPQAIIEGKIVKVGDIVKDVKINKITRNGVEGDFKGVKVHLKP